MKKIEFISSLECQSFSRSWKRKAVSSRSSNFKPVSLVPTMFYLMKKVKSTDLLQRETS